MNAPILNRRNMLLAGVGATVAWPSLGMEAAKAAGLDLNDPRERARLIAVTRGSTVPETVYTLCRLHIYAYHHRGNVVPMMTMTNLNVGQWRPLANGNFTTVFYEAGAYTKFDSNELISTWRNPETGALVEIPPFLAGPATEEVGPEGWVTPEGRKNDTEILNVEIFGDTVMVPRVTTRSYPNPFPRDKFPKGYAGPTIYWDSHSVTFSSLKEIADRSRTSVASSMQFQNLGSWMPWFEMGERPGRTWGRAYGSKLSGLDEIPAAYRTQLEAQTPQIFELDKWKSYRDEATDFGSGSSAARARNLKESAACY